ncbi:hypothetical protein GCM10027447_25530 [Glycomyces halotolerans]
MSGVTDCYLRLRPEYSNRDLSEALSAAEIVAPRPDPRAVDGLKFSAALPIDLAAATLAARLSDPHNAKATLDAPRTFTS